MKTFCLTKIIVVLLLFIFGFSKQQSDLLAQQQNEQIKKEIKALSDSIFARANKLDTEVISLYYSPHLVVVRDTLLFDYKAWKKAWADFMTNAPEDGGSQGSVISAFGVIDDPRGEGFLVQLEQPVPVVNNMSYPLTLTLESGSGQLVLSGAATANETSRDDGQPLRIDNNDGYGGIYQPGLNFEMYWDDNADKLQRFYETLDQSDYIFITLNRQWGSLPRMPERYPLSIAYYRSLLGCPPDRQIEWCYAIAQPGRFRETWDLSWCRYSSPTRPSARCASMTSSPRKPSPFTTTRKCWSSARPKITTRSRYDRYWEQWTSRMSSISRPSARGAPCYANPAGGALG